MSVYQHKMPSLKDKHLAQAEEKPKKPTKTKK